MSKLRIEYVAKGTTVIDCNEYNNMTVDKITEEIKSEVIARIVEDHEVGLTEIEVNVLKFIQDEELAYEHTS